MAEKLDKIQNPSRRIFLKKAGVASMAIGTGALAGVSATGCTSDESGVQVTLQDEPQSAARATRRRNTGDRSVQGYFRVRW